MDLVTKQIEKGNVFRSQFELGAALECKAHYEEVLRDINEKLTLIKKR